MKIFNVLMCILLWGYKIAMADDECPQPNGLFGTGDKANCGEYKNCVHGRAHILKCGDGLAWSTANNRCDWPDEVEDCDAEAYLGFTCPDEPQSAAQYTLHPNPGNTQQYFVCTKGRPRRLSCPEKQTFNAESKQCADN